MNRNNFDPSMVQRALNAQDITPEETTRLLAEACHVIHGLRNDLSVVIKKIRGLSACSTELNQHWMGEDRVGVKREE